MIQISWYYNRIPFLSSSGSEGAVLINGRKEMCGTRLDFLDLADDGLNVCLSSLSLINKPNQTASHFSNGKLDQVRGFFSSPISRRTVAVMVLSSQHLFSRHMKGAEDSSDTSDTSSSSSSSSDDEVLDEQIAAPEAADVVVAEQPPVPDVPNDEADKPKKPPPKGGRILKALPSWRDFLSPADLAPTDAVSVSNRIMTLLRSHLRDLLYADKPLSAEIAELIMGKKLLDPEILWKLGVQVIRTGARTYEDGIRRACRWLQHLMAIKMPVAIKMDVLLEHVILLSDLGNFEEALQRLQTHLSQEPYARNALLHGYAGLLSYKLWRAELATTAEHWSQQAQYSQMVDTAPESDAATQHRTQALDSFRTSVGLEVRNELFVAHLVHLLELAGETVETMTILSKLVDKDPSNLIANRYYLAFIQRHKEEIGEDTPAIRACRLATFRLNPAEDVRLTLVPLFAYWDPILSFHRIRDPVPDNHHFVGNLRKLNADIDKRAIFVEKLIKIELLLDHLDFAESSRLSALVPDDLDGTSLDPWPSPEKWAWGNLVDAIHVISEYDLIVHDMIWSSRKSWWLDYHFGAAQRVEADFELITLKSCAAFMCFRDRYATMGIRQRLIQLGADPEICERYGIAPEELLDPTATANAVHLANQPKPVFPRVVDISQERPILERRLRGPFAVDTIPNLHTPDDRTWILATLEDIRRALVDPESIIEGPDGMPTLSPKASIILFSPNFKAVLDPQNRFVLTRDNLRQFVNLDPFKIQQDWVRLVHPDKWTILEDLKIAERKYLDVKEPDEEAERSWNAKVAARAIRKEAKEDRARLAKAVNTQIIDVFGVERSAMEAFIGTNLRLKNFLE